MIRIRKGTVKRIIQRDEKTTIIDVAFDGKIERAINYNYITGDIELNDSVYINTTANYLNLGTGGYNFIIINENRGSHMDVDSFGHIMKLRYTPYQIKCCSANELNDKYNDAIRNFKDLNNTIVICGELHSMLSPVACTLKYMDNNIKIVYIMTDGGCLPIDFSFTVKELKEKGLISHTITCGHAFGGDMEAVNIYDALVIAKAVLKCDVAVVMMGPGMLGTGTKYGFSGMEQGFIIDSVNTLKGTPIFIPRISFEDKRNRHYGISHHTLTILSEISKTKAHVVFPILEGDNMELMQSQIDGHNICNKHMVRFVNSNIIFKAMDYYKVKASTMGRDLYDDKEFFLSCGAAAVYAHNLLKCI